LNVFYLHVVKMVLESCQLLSTVHHLHGSAGPYKINHEKHPSTIWAAQSRENYAWLWDHFQALSEEYTRRYHKTHASAIHLEFLRDAPESVPSLGLIDPPQCMPDEFKLPGDPVEAYRRYYRGAKREFARWKDGNIPEWFNPPHLSWEEWE
jgi:hypothetical protein